MLAKILEKLVLIQTTLAQTEVIKQPPLSSGLRSTKPLKDILDDLTGFAAGLALSIAVLMIVYAGWQMLTAGGNSEQFESGKKTITYAVVGILVVLISATIVEIVRTLLGAQ